MFIKFLLSSLLFLSSVDQAYSMVEPEDKQGALFKEAYKKLTNKDEITYIDIFDKSIEGYNINIWPATYRITVEKKDNIKSEKIIIKKLTIFEIYSNDNLFYIIDLNEAIDKSIKDIIKKYKLSFNLGKNRNEHIYMVSIDDFYTFLNTCVNNNFISRGLVDWLSDNNFLPGIEHTKIEIKTEDYHIFENFVSVLKNQSIELQEKVNQIIYLLNHMNFYDHKYDMALYNIFYDFKEGAKEIYKNQRTRFKDDEEKLKQLEKMKKSHKADIKKLLKNTEKDTK